VTQEKLLLLTVEGLRVSYGRVAAVRGVSLSCAAGEVVALLGPNGAGKSSTLLGIAGALDHASVGGAVTLDGWALDGRPAEQIARAGLALVPERRRIFASLTVRENLLLGASAWAKRAAAERELCSCWSDSTPWRRFASGRPACSQAVSSNNWRSLAH
jgi:branched-chain amino acid transport system ATP-binding protein